MSGISDLMLERIRRLIPELRGQLEEYCDVRREIESWSDEADVLWEGLIGTATNLIFQIISEQPDNVDKLTRFVDEIGLMIGLDDIRARVDTNTLIRKVAEVLAAACVGGAASAELRADRILSSEGLDGEDEAPQGS